MLNLSNRGLTGVALMLVGTALFASGIVPSLTGIDLLLGLAAVLLTAGTYLVGTDVSGRIV